MTDAHAERLLAAAATLVDAIVNRAPGDFLDAAVRECARACASAYEVQSFADLPDGLFAWGRTSNDHHADAEQLAQLRLDYWH